MATTQVKIQLLLRSKIYIQCLILLIIRFICFDIPNPLLNDHTFETRYAYVLKTVPADLLFVVSFFSVLSPLYSLFNMFIFS